VNREPDPDGSELGEGADEFEAIIAGWRDEGDVPRWPDQPVPVVRRHEPVEDDDHFVPPEPPPLPRIGPPAAVGMVLIVLGIVLIATPRWVGVPEIYGVPLGLVSIASGLAWLVLRLWPDHSADDRDDGDDGAVL
jgi:hypothetical protein